MGMIATAWTVLLPVAALALVVLSILQATKPRPEVDSSH
jgi:hypothetical protein